MKGFLLDTNICIFALRDKFGVNERLEEGCRDSIGKFILFIIFDGISQRGAHLLEVHACCKMMHIFEPLYESFNIVK